MRDMFDTYIALGDSMSIDFYAAQDAGRLGLASREDIGAAALFFSNDDHLFPEFSTRDLITRFPAIRYFNLCIDGATSEDLLSAVRLKDVEKISSQSALVTLTLGGNDLLEAFRRNVGSGSEQMARAAMSVLQRYEQVIRAVKERLPDGIIVLTTVFDPTDGTGILPTTSPIYDTALPIEYLNHFNDFVKSCAKSHSALLADVHKHFFGHGAGCGSADDFWYWKASPIEPSYRGSSEIRRVWLEALEGHLESRA